MKVYKAGAAAIIAATILTGCTPDEARTKLDNAASSAQNKMDGVSKKVDESVKKANDNLDVNSSGSESGAPSGVQQDPFKRGGNYYAVLGKAQFDSTCNITYTGQDVYNYRGILNGAGQVGSACGKIGSKHKRINPVDDPAGFSKNSITTIPSVSGNDSYHGYFYNRSHMISAALGGDPHAKNLITGTRMQNVGESNKGGMRYTESKAEKYVSSPDAKKCPLTYEVTPHYRNSTDAVPTWTEVNMKSCDGSLNERVAVFNDAAGFKIDYSNGNWSKN